LWIVILDLFGDRDLRGRFVDDVNHAFWGRHGKIIRGLGI
jgi:hypothetical protein